MNPCGRQSAEWARFWVRGGVEHLYARYVTHTFAPHAHEGYVFAVVGAGAEGFRYRGSAHHLRPGFVGLLNPGEVHTGHAESAGGWLYRTLYPSVEAVTGALAAASGQAHTPYFPQAVVYDPDLVGWVRRYHRLSEHGDESAREEAFIELVACAVARHAERGSPERRTAQEPGAVALTRAFLEAHPQDDVTLAELGTLTGLSPYALLRAFRRHTGLTPHAYRTLRRVERAKAQLLRGAAIATVAADMGFFDQSHLGRHFKRVVGVTPRVFVRGAIPS